MIDILGFGVNPKISITEDRAFIGVCFDIVPPESNGEVVRTIEMALPAEQAMLLMEALKEAQRLFDIPIPETTSLLSRV